MQIAIPRPVVRRSIMLLVAVAMLALTLISLAGMSASMLVVESARGSASVINIAGSLRRYTQRVANLIASMRSAAASRPRAWRQRSRISRPSSSILRCCDSSSAHRVNCSPPPTAV